MPSRISLALDMASELSQEWSESSQQGKDYAFEENKFYF
jgi:hypothetical protein